MLLYEVTDSIHQNAQINSIYSADLELHAWAPAFG